MTCLRRLFSARTSATLLHCCAAGALQEATAKGSDGALIVLDLGLSAATLIGQPGQSVYLVRFVCGCLGVVGRGQMILRVNGFGLVCSCAATSRRPN